MDRSTTIYLISETIEYDAIRQPIVTATSRREVLAQFRSVARAEWFEAGRNGLRPNITFVVRYIDYEGETLIEWDGEMYSVYRTFLNRGDQVELYCEKRGGLNG